MSDRELLIQLCELIEECFRIFSPEEEIRTKYNLGTLLKESRAIRKKLKK